MTLTFNTVLIANRGEIACRIIRTARRLGLRTVAVYSDADAATAHVRDADEAIRLGDSDPAASYLDIDKVLAAAKSAGAGAIHPGYGFLSENADFAERVTGDGLAFVGPTAHQLRIFGDKHTARRAAGVVGVPLVAGSGLLTDPDHAAVEAERIGFPVIVKAVGGGGGIGLQVCQRLDEVRDAYERVSRLSGTHFSAAGVFVERYVARARHVEVQVFGDGAGTVITMGTRDCSLQRRNQKVIEEAPAPALPVEVEQMLLDTSRALAESVDYRSAGTVEFVFDAERGEASFLEMNTRLQVEHPVTELVTGIDLVEWMLRSAGGDNTMLAPFRSAPPPIRGHAIEARLYAEDPVRDYRPAPGTITAVRFPDSARVDGWIDAGTAVSPFYDPLLAKVITSGDDRGRAIVSLARALDATEIYGVTSNLAQLRQALTESEVLDAEHTTRTLTGVRGTRRRVDVVRAGTSTTLQDLPGRLGVWSVGIPPSGPMDDVSFAAANRAVGNPRGTVALEATLHGPRLQFADPTRIAVTGAPASLRINGADAPMWTAIGVPAGGIVDIGAPTDAGLRTYIAVAGGFDAPDYLGSAATFTLGGFGGVTGRDLRDGDVLTTANAPVGAEHADAPIRVTHDWALAVTPGPQASGDYFTPDDLARLYTHAWKVGGHANRTGIRLEGPRPEWARSDGGDAGLHPSNLHDNPYSVGALNVSGDTPILLGPDGPSLGGFVCPVTVVSAERWKMGQLRPGDTVRFVPVSDDAATRLRRATTRPGQVATPALRTDTVDEGLLHRLEATDTHPRVWYQRGGDDNILIEYGDMSSDLGPRMRVHALSEALEQAGLPGIIDATPGVRTLHLHFDPDLITPRRLVGTLADLESDIGATHDLRVRSRHLRLPLSFDDPSLTEALDRYRTGVRAEAPWLPSNIEFIRRINGLDTIDEVRDTVLDATYLVLGLGDVYLGAPLALPLDPRHRLVTTKYNPARTWTPADAVGIGGRYLCVYGMASPGGYQLFGRTLPIWSSHRHTPPFEPDRPWLFRYFDRISWEPVTPDELTGIREAARLGHYHPDITHGTFTLAEHHQFLDEHADDIAAIDTRRRRAFDTERAAWEASGEFDRATEADITSTAPTTAGIAVPDGATLISAPMSGSVWRVEARPGQHLDGGATVAVLEAMKLELPVTAPASGCVLSVLVEPGTQVDPGTPLAVIGAP